MNTKNVGADLNPSHSCYKKGVRDGWSDGIFAQNFAYDVLSLAGVGRSGVFKAAFINTAQSIINQRTPDGFYGAGWSGPKGHQTSWDELGQSALGITVTIRSTLLGDWSLN